MLYLAKLVQRNSQRQMNKYLEKIASLLKGRKLLGKITTGNKASRIKLSSKSPSEAKATNNIVDLHAKGEDAIEQGKKFKDRAQFIDGSQAFVRGAPGKGVRSRIYSRIQKMAEDNLVIKDDKKAMASAPKANDKYFTRMKIRGC